MVTLRENFPEYDQMHKSLHKCRKTDLMKIILYFIYASIKYFIDPRVELVKRRFVWDA